MQKLSNRISNNLYEGQYSSFADAINDLRLAFELERDTEIDELGVSFWQKEIDKVDKAWSIYEETEFEEEIIKKLYEAGLENFALALENEDYSYLAY